MKFKLTDSEKKWVWYDVGNSAFTLLVCTIIPIYFNTLAENAGISETDYLAYFGYATSASTLLVALTGPTLGTLSDISGLRKKIFSVMVLIGAAGCIILSFISSWLWFLLLFVIAKSAYSVSLVIYDSMLGDVTSPERMDEVSSYGYGLGYIGSCAPFILSLIPVILAMQGMLSQAVAMPIAFIIVAVWWVGFSVPLWKDYRQIHFVDSASHPVKTGAKNLAKVFKELWHEKKILFFLIAFFCYIDGVYTIIDMATAYGQSLGLDTTMLLIALLVTQIVAFPSAILLGKLSRSVRIEIIIGICIAAYLGISVYAIFLNEIYEFWILAVCVGLFQGTIQALSRSYYAKIIPLEKSGEYFGVYDIFGKGAAFTGTLLVSIVTQATDNQNYGVGSLAVMFALGIAFFILAVRCKDKTAAERSSVDSPSGERVEIAVASGDVSDE